MNPIPVFDLGSAVRPLMAEIEGRWRSLTANTSFVGGREVEEFESSFASFLDSAGCVGVANGTDALVLALWALDLRPGDEIIVPSFTFIATAAAVVLAGGRPVFADVEPTTLNLDPESLAARISERTVGVIGVHLYGRPFAVDRILDLCRRRGLWLLEDAAQAHGAEWEGRRVGTFGRLATWSFYPSKNLGCFGDGGAVTGNDAELLERVRRLANHGRVEHYHHSEVGSNSRLDALQAAVLNCRLPLLEADNERRGEIAGRYREVLGDLDGLELLVDPAAAQSVYHQFTVLTSRRDELRRFLADEGISTAIHYPLALHLQPAFETWVDDRDALPVASAAGSRVLCLPMYPQLAAETVDDVCRAIRRFFNAD